jgi:Na+/melibiose symporter-like transporter
MTGWLVLVSAIPLVGVAHIVSSCDTSMVNVPSVALSAEIEMPTRPYAETSSLTPWKVAAAASVAASLLLKEVVDSLFFVDVVPIMIFG